MKTKSVLLPVILFLSFSIFNCNKDEGMETATSSQLSVLRRPPQGDPPPSIPTWINDCGDLRRSKQKPQERTCFKNGRVINANWRIL